MIRVVCPGICNVVKYLLSVQTIALSYSQQPDRSEGALCIDVQTFALTTAHADRQLAGDGKSVTELGLSRTELAKHLRDRARFDTACREVR